MTKQGDTEELEGEELEYEQERNRVLTQMMSDAQSIINKAKPYPSGSQEMAIHLIRLMNRGDDVWRYLDGLGVVIQQIRTEKDAYEARKNENAHFLESSPEKWAISQQEEYNRLRRENENLAGVLGDKGSALISNLDTVIERMTVKFSWLREKMMQCKQDDSAEADSKARQWLVDSGQVPEPGDEIESEGVVVEEGRGGILRRLFR